MYCSLEIFRCQKLTFLWATKYTKIIYMIIITMKFIYGDSNGDPTYVILECYVSIYIC